MILTSSLTVLIKIAAASANMPILKLAALFAIGKSNCWSFAFFSIKCSGSIAMVNNIGGSGSPLSQPFSMFEPVTSDTIQQY
jgi:hypothetical protein